MTGAGRRRDGKPFKEGNTDENGSYKVGKGRTPEQTRFASGDGRKRGKRPKGSRNFETDWEEELTKKVRVTRNGKVEKVSAHHAQVMRTLEMASKGRERSQELLFRQAEKLQERRQRVSTRSDDDLIAAWMAGQAGDAGNSTVVGDDWSPEDKDGAVAGSDGAGPRTAATTQDDEGAPQ